MPIEVAHVRNGSDGGISRKPSDFFCLSLCRDHHSEQHQIGETSFEKRHGISMLELAEAFANASPKAPEIKAKKRELAA